MTLVVIGGISCSGKSTLATRLQSRLSWPLIAKDSIKEVLFDTLGTGDATWSRRLSDAAYAVLFQQAAQCLRTGQSCLIEANFRHNEHEPRLQQLLTLAGDCGLQIHCRADADILFERFCARRRHPGHLDDVQHADARRLFESTVQQPLGLSVPIVICDTSVDWQSAIEAACVAAERALTELGVRS